MEKSKARVIDWIVWLTLALLIVAILTYVLDKRVYNSRYDADAVAAGTVEYSFEANGNDVGAATFTSSAGDINYGYSQSAGTTYTTYELSFKETSKGEFKRLKTFTIYSLNDYTGEFDLTYNSYTCRYDLKLRRMNNKSGSQTVKIDWGVN